MRDQRQALLDAGHLEGSWAEKARGEEARRVMVGGRQLCLAHRVLDRRCARRES